VEQPSVIYPNTFQAPPSQLQKTTTPPSESISSRNEVLIDAIKTRGIEVTNIPHPRKRIYTLTVSLPCPLGPVETWTRRTTTFITIKIKPGTKKQEGKKEKGTPPQSSNLTYLVDKPYLIGKPKSTIYISHKTLRIHPSRRDSKKSRQSGSSKSSSNSPKHLIRPRCEPTTQSTQQTSRSKA
jgi:hypothetical protein